MEKSIEALRKKMSNNRIFEETTESINAEAVANIYKKVRFYTKNGISFPGRVEELADVSTKSLDNTSQEPLIPKPRPK